MIGVSPREWVGAFYFVVGVVILAIFGLRPLTALLILSIVLMTMIAGRACSLAEFSYWEGLRVIASINLTGETFIMQIFVLPALALATLYSWVLGITWVFGAREWPRKRWFAFLRGYRDVVLRAKPKD
jgi:hypothetical protein